MDNVFGNVTLGRNWIVEVRPEDAGSIDPYLHEQDGRFGENGSDFKLPSVIGILPIRNAVAYPGTVTPLAVGRKPSKALLADIEPNESIIGLLTQRNTETETPNFRDLYSIGTAASVLKVIKLPQGTMHVLAHGIARFNVIEKVATKPYLKARIRQLNVKMRMTKRIRALIVSVRQAANRVIELSPNVPDDASVLLENIEDPSALADFLAANLSLDIAKKQQLLEELDAAKRLDQISIVLAHQLEVLELSHKIQGRVRESVDKNQREYYLQEQLKAIQSELGQKDFQTEDLKQIGENIAKSNMPDPVEQEAL
ncbi:MAG: LON peptidase substrate-binding domain-containing protein, partial [Phycisphaerales bacterium]